MKPVIALPVVAASAALAVWQAALEPAPLPVPPPASGPEPRPVPGAPSGETTAAFNVPGSSNFQVIEERILFVPDRRIPAPEALPAAGAAPSAEPPPPQLRLLGTFVSGSARIALISLDGEQHPRAVRQGDAFAGWTIEEVAARQVAIRFKDGGATVLLLHNAQPETSPPKRARSPFVSARR